MHTGWPYFKEMVSNIAVVGCIENRQWLKHVCSCLILLWWFLDVIIMSWLSASMLGELNPRAVQFVHGFQYPCPLVVSALPHLGLAFWLVLANGTIAYVTRSKDLESACALGLVLLESCHQAQASLLEDETPCGKKLVVSQPPVSLAAGYSYMCESQPRSTRVARVSRISQFSPI